jgi:succinate dehydrogenase flavin-adding protein (antitoxin of CptAB toxin-antitoxin module)
MTCYEELNLQNHKITELSNVLSVLLKDRSLCDTETCCSIFYNYMDQVNDHMKKVDSNMYSNLLKHQSSDANITANNFMSGSQEIKRIMKTYVRKWCGKANHDLSIGKGQHEIFLRETDDMFEMILNRVQDEMENLYPMVRKISA